MIPLSENGAIRRDAAAPFELRAGAGALAVSGRLQFADGPVRHSRRRMMLSEPTHETMPASVPVARPVFRWYHKISAVLFITFCLEIGFFLLTFPWTEFLETNYFAAYIPE